MRRIHYSIVLTLVITAFVSPNSYAQLKWIGAKGGLSIPSLSSGTTDNPISSGYNSRLGPDVALFSEHELNTHFALVFQLEYSSQGGKKDGQQAFATPTNIAQMFPPGQAPEILYANYNSEAKLSYLMVPILAKYTIPLSKSWHFYVAAGPFVSFLLSAKNVTSGASNIYLDKEQTQPLLPPGTTHSFDSTENIASQLHSSNFGVEALVGLSYEFAHSRIFFEAGGNYGFVNIQKYDMDGKNNTGAAVISLGYAWKLSN